MNGAYVVGPIGEARGFRRITLDLILLSLDPVKRGKRDTRNLFALALAGYAVMALELIQLAELGRIVITDRKSAGKRFLPLPASWLGAHWIKVTSTVPSGLPELDAELGELSATGRRPAVELQTWIAGRYEGQCQSYLGKLAAVGAVYPGSASSLGPRWFLGEAGRLPRPRRVPGLTRSLREAARSTRSRPRSAASRPPSGSASACTSASAIRAAGCSRSPAATASCSRPDRSSWPGSCA